MKRFLLALTLVACMGAVTACGGGAAQKKSVGIQLYSLHQDMGNVEASLQRLADIGYTSVETLNGNGDPNDEIPMIGAIDTYGAKIDTYLMCAFIYDDGQNRLMINDDGQVIAVFTQPEFKEGLKYLAGLYSENLIYPDSFEGGDVDEPDRYRFVYSVVEFLDAVIDIGGQERMRPVEPELPFDFEQGRAHRDLDRPSCVFADDRKGV